MYRTLFLFGILIISPLNLFAQPSVNVATYDDLVHEVRAAFARGEERTADAVERERVQTYWEAGKLIDEHILLHKERAEYGKEVMPRLANDLGISLTEIRFMVQFARAYPIRRPVSELSWSHYERLLSINDPEERDKLAQKAVEKKWSRQELQNEIKKLKAENSQVVNDDLTEEPLIPIKGTLNTYQIVKKEGEDALLIDLGFSNYLELPEKYRKKFKEGDIVSFVGARFPRPGAAPAPLQILKDAQELDLFTYKAKVLDVTDGDTLWLWIDLGFGIRTKQHVRLRGIDAPEIATRDGQAAKAYVEKELKDISEILITTSKSDKYDRYLVDIFYPAKAKEKFLNNELLIHGLAERV